MSKQKRILTEEEKIKLLEAKKELNEFRENIKYIEEKLNDNEETKSKLEKVISNFSENPEKFEEIISKLEASKLYCRNKMKELLLKKLKIDEKIDSMKQPYKNILFYRYTRRENWKEISNKLGYSRDYICELHSEALYQYSKLS